MTRTGSCRLMLKSRRQEHRLANISIFKFLCDFPAMQKSQSRFSRRYENTYFYGAQTHVCSTGTVPNVGNAQRNSFARSLTLQIIKRKNIVSYSTISATSFNYGTFIANSQKEAPHLTSAQCCATGAGGFVIIFSPRAKAVITNYCSESLP
jgi:hypothetical protein